jgi:tetratricopeptide (TPR) repeat protein
MNIVAALKKWTSEGESCHWAAAQNNLCWTLLNIAKMEHDQNQLERIEPDQNQIKQLNLAICSCLNALKEWPRGSWDRPIAHDNLGLAYTKRGELENDTASLNQGVNAHRCALEELEKLTPDRPRRRADAKRNLGTALVALGNRTGDTKLLEQALTDFDQSRPCKRTLTISARYPRQPHLRVFPESMRGRLSCAWKQLQAVEQRIHRWPCRCCHVRCEASVRTRI